MSRRFKKILIQSAIAVGLILAAAVAWGAWSAWIAGGRLNSRLDAIRAAGDPTSIADFGAPELSREDDADALLEQAAPGVAALEKEMLKLYPKSGRPAGPLDADSLARLDAVFKAHPDVVPRLIEAASRAEYSHRFASTSHTTRFTQEVGDRTARFRSMIRILASWSSVLRARGDRDGAVAVAVASLRLSDDLGRDPGLMSTLAAIACGYVSVQDAAETLLSGPVSEESRRSLDAELGRFDAPRLLTHALKTERAFSISSFREMPTAPIPFAGWLRDGAVLMILDLYEKELEIVDLPYLKAKAASGAIAAQLPLHPMRPMATLLAPALQSLREAVVRQAAMARSLRVLNALQRTGAEAEPADLASLSLPAEATIDPFTEKPLIAKKRPDGWLVYSVGSDLADDGGILEKVRDVGVGPVSAPAAGGNPSPGSSSPPASP
ncbi:MAG: hypothetical protein BGO49_26675 [Planctomycetales bacterium 71-10]|nr:MAG: hypothetical protein BGO49_26675 [Planctomycetales bacterium 71-10]